MNRRSIVVAVCILLIAGFGAAVLFKPQPQPPQQTAPAVETSDASTGAVENQQALVRFHSPTFGPADAPVTIVEFFDYRCSYCKRNHPILTRYRDRNASVKSSARNIRSSDRNRLWHRGRRSPRASKGIGSSTTP